MKPDNINNRNIERFAHYQSPPLPLPLIDTGLINLTVTTDNRFHNRCGIN
jgi:hypothetical protein